MKALENSNLTEEVKAKVKADAQALGDWNDKFDMKWATTVMIASQDILPERGEKGIRNAAYMRCLHHALIPMPVQ